MRKLLLPLALAGGLAVSGCSTYGGGPLGGILGSVLGGNNSGYNNQRLNDFERAAANACGREAQQYGRVSLRDVDQEDRDYVRVRGTVEDRRGRRDSFNCIFRSDGRIVEFRF